MNLWTEYEGRTIAGAYTLGKLVRSEGRNGFFTTADKTGQPAVIRLTESHFDEDEQIARWRQVAGIQQPNLIGIERVGKTSFEGVALTFALMEPNDAVLADVLQERPLTTTETLQVARAVVAALAALHGNGLVHEHVDATNVLAVGETVKLRSDCVRECVADKEFNTPEGCAELRRKDVHDFAVLLLYCLTLEKEMHPGINLPEPFYRVIPGALEGTLSLEQLSAILTPPSVPQPLPASPSPAAAVPTVAPVQPGPVVTPVSPRAVAAAAALAETAPRPEQAELPLHFRPRNDVQRDVEPATTAPDWTRWAMIGGAALILLMILWHFTVGRPKPVAPAPIVAATAPAAPAEVAAPAKPSPLVGSGLGAAPGWYVVAYTYNRPAQAQAKADALARRHASLAPRVFSPTGGAPYYVALGGPMTQADAATVLRHARRSGLPRDTFMRNF